MSQSEHPASRSTVTLGEKLSGCNEAFYKWDKSKYMLLPCLHWSWNSEDGFFSLQVYIYTVLKCRTKHKTLMDSIQHSNQTYPTYVHLYNQSIRSVR